MSRRHVAAAALLTTFASAAGAQVPRPTVQPELRLDVIAGRQPAMQLGAGTQIPIGYYVRVGLVGAVGIPTGGDAPSPRRADARADVLIRFQLDPFRQSAYGLSVGGGLSARAEPGDRVRPRLLVAADLEGRRSAHGIVPAIQLGLGGGVRIGVLLRRGARGMR